MDPYLECRLCRCELTELHPYSASYGCYNIDCHGSYELHLSHNRRAVLESFKYFGFYVENHIGNYLLVSTKKSATSKLINIYNSFSILDDTIFNILDIYLNNITKQIMCKVCGNDVRDYSSCSVCKKYSVEINHYVDVVKEWINLTDVFIEVDYEANAFIISESYEDYKNNRHRVSGLYNVDIANKIKNYILMQ